MTGPCYRGTLASGRRPRICSGAWHLQRQQLDFERGLWMALGQGQWDSVRRLGSPPCLWGVGRAPAGAPLRPPRKVEAGAGGSAVTGLFFLLGSRLAHQEANERCHLLHPLKPPPLTHLWGEGHLGAPPVNQGATGGWEGSPGPEIPVRSTVTWRRPLRQVCSSVPGHPLDRCVPRDR